MADPKNKISIVTISFNQREFLQECIDSIISQQYTKLEYILVDPGSTDGSQELVQQYGDSINHVFEPDDGPSDGLKKGFSKCSGDIYAYLNADDRFALGAFDFVDNYFSTHPDIDVLCGAINMIDRKGLASVRKRTSDNFDLARYASGVSTIGQQATFFRATAYEKAGGFNPNNRITWDGELLVDMALAGCKFVSVKKVLGDFRIYSESITGSQRHKDLYDTEMKRVKDKIGSHGIKTYEGISELLVRLRYKLNLARHLGYLSVK